MSTCNLVAELVWKDIEFKRTVIDDQLAVQLSLLFATPSVGIVFNFERATRIVDQRGVKMISREPSGRFIFQDVGESRRK